MINSEERYGGYIRASRNTRENRMMKAVEHVKILKSIVSDEQLLVMANGCRTPEKDYFFGKLEEYAERFKTMPKTYEQDGKGDDAVVYLHYFKGGFDWYITEKDMIEEEQHQAFGYADMGCGGELGYISLIELAENNVELDLHWTPKTLREVKESRA